MDLNNKSLFESLVLDSVYLNDTTASTSENLLYDIPAHLVVLLCICYGIVSISAVVGNFMIVWILWRSPRMRNATNYFIANLSVADMIIGVFAIPFQFQAALLQRWDLPWFMCSFCPTVTIISVNVSIFTLTAVAIDRYRAIVHPLKTHTSDYWTKLTIVLIWVVSVSLAVPTPVAFNVEMLWDDGAQNYLAVCHNVGLSQEFFNSYNHSLVALQYFVPVSIILIVYFRIITELSSKKNDVELWQASVNSGVAKSRKKVIKMLFIVMALFTGCWLPLQLYNILQGIFPQINNYRYINLIWFFCHWLAMSNSCYNPIIYFIYSKKFKSEFRSRFGCFCRQPRVNRRQQSNSATRLQSLSLCQRVNVEAIRWEQTFEKI